MEKLYDAVVIGAGPAGLSAAIYMARAQYRVLVLEKDTIGGQITITSEVVNYPGILKTDGETLTRTMRDQAILFGAEFLIAEVQDAELTGDIKTIKTDKGAFHTVGVIIATGASPRKAGFEGEEEFRGRGVAYCATCDGEFFTGSDIFVIGGGFAAAEEALFLTRYARKVTVIVRGEAFSCAESIAKEVITNDRIEVKFQTELIQVTGENGLKTAILKNNQTGETTIYKADLPEGFGVFVFAGYTPATDVFKGKIELTEAGYIVADRNQKTNVDGVYAAGDVCVKNLRQVVTAVADGAVAATSLEKHAAAMHKKLNITKEDTRTARRAVQKEETAAAAKRHEGFITTEMQTQLLPVFDKFERNLLLKGFLDERNISKEVKSFMDEIGGLSEKIAIEIVDSVQAESEKIRYPSIALYDETGEYLGVQFHGVPGGHEFNSFIVALYNAAGPGQPIDEKLLGKIKVLKKDINIKVVVSLSCTMCPEVVMAASRIALENKRVEMEMYDMAYFPDLVDAYQIKSVPCMIINDSRVYFGKKSVSQLLELLSTL